MLFLDELYIVSLLARAKNARCRAPVEEHAGVAANLGEAPPGCSRPWPRSWRGDKPLPDLVPKADWLLGS